MKKEEIEDIIKSLREEYLEKLDDGYFSTIVDIHDEITRWERELKEKEIYFKKGNTK